MAMVMMIMLAGPLEEKTETGILLVVVGRGRYRRRKVSRTRYCSGYFMQKICRGW